MGTIYLITCNIDGMQYIGQTCNPVEIRWNAHRKCAENLKKYYAGEITECCVKRSCLYNSMVTHGVKNFTFEIIEDDIPENELDEMEIYFIKEYNTIKPNGFNLTTGGGHFRHHADTKKLMSDLARAKAPELIDKYRKEETKGLPMNIVSHSKGKSKGYAICGHPLCSYKSFTLKNYKTMEDCKEAAKQFLANLESSGIRHEWEKTQSDLPVGITKFRTGYLVKRKINGVMYKKVFEGKQIPDEIKLRNAKNYLAEINNKE